MFSIVATFDIVIVKSLPSWFIDFAAAYHIKILLPLCFPHPNGSSQAFLFKYLIHLFLLFNIAFPSTPLRAIWNFQPASTLSSIDLMLSKNMFNCLSHFISFLIPASFLSNIHLYHTVTPLPPTWNFQRATQHNIPTFLRFSSDSSSQSFHNCISTQDLKNEARTPSTNISTLKIPERHS